MLPEALVENDEDSAAVNAEIERMLAEGKLLLTRKRKLALPEHTGMQYGRVQGNARGFGFFLPEDGGVDLFIPAESMFGAMHGDKVWVKKTENVSRNGSPEGEVAMIALRASARLVGTFESGNAGAYVVPDEKRIPTDVLVFGQDMGKAQTGDKVVVEIIQYPDGRRPLTGKVVEVLGKSGQDGTDMLSIIRRLSLPDAFGKGTLRLAKSLNKPVPADETLRREDLRSQTTITIDGEDAKDFDDAISLSALSDGRYILGVHIADVSWYVGERSALDKEAYERGTSVYLPGRVLPMLPEDISNGVCSLNENEDKLTLSCIMELDATGRVISHRIGETVIRSAHRMTYEDVNKMFAGDEALIGKYADIWPMLQNMRHVMELLNAIRVKRGSIDFDLNEAKITLDEDGKAIDVSVYERGVSNRMIEAFMLLANETVASHVKALRVPFLYRVHEAPDKLKLQALNTFLGTMGHGLKNINNIKPSALAKVLERIKGTKEENVISRVVLRTMQKARYSEESLGHFGLATHNYCHFTSPIRRYPDLVVHRILKEVIHGTFSAKRIAQWEENLPEIAQHCSNREVVAMEAERAADDLKKCEYMQRHVGAVETGIISGVAQRGFFVGLSNTVEGMVRIASIEGDYYVCDEKNYRIVGRNSGRILMMGDEVRVRVVRVDMDSANIDFELYEGNGGNGRSANKRPGQNGGRGKQAKSEAGAPKAQDAAGSSNSGTKDSVGAKPRTSRGRRSRKNGKRKETHE